MSIPAGLIRVKLASIRKSFKKTSRSERCGLARRDLHLLERKIANLRRICVRSYLQSRGMIVIADKDWEAGRLGMDCRQGFLNFLLYTSENCDPLAAERRRLHVLTSSPAGSNAKGAIAMLYGEPATARFLVAVQRLKRQQQQKVRLTRLAKQRVRTALRKVREC